MNHQPQFYDTSTHNPWHLKILIQMLLQPRQSRYSSKSLGAGHCYPRHPLQVMPDISFYYPKSLHCPFNPGTTVQSCNKSPSIIPWLNFIVQLASSQPPLMVLKAEMQSQETEPSNFYSSPLIEAEEDIQSGGFEAVLPHNSV